MNTAEKVQVAALAAIFFFLSYITYYTVHQTLSSRPRRVSQVPAKTLKDSPNELFTRGRNKASQGDCAGALKDLDAAASLDSSLKDQITTALDTCKKK